MGYSQKVELLTGKEGGYKLKTRHEGLTAEHHKTGRSRCHTGRDNSLLRTNWEIPLTLQCPGKNGLTEAPEQLWCDEAVALSSCPSYGCLSLMCAPSFCSRTRGRGEPQATHRSRRQGSPAASAKLPRTP